MLNGEAPLSMGRSDKMNDADRKCGHSLTDLGSS